MIKVASVIIPLNQLMYSHQVGNAVENLDRYWSVLTGDQQPLDVNTKAHGYVGLKFQDDLTRLVFIANAENIGNVTGIYIYKDGKNQNGTVLLDLLNGTRKVKKDIDKFVNITSEGQMTGTLAIGGATKDDLQGALKGKSLSDLHKIIVNMIMRRNLITKMRGFLQSSDFKEQYKIRFLGILGKLKK